MIDRQLSREEILGYWVESAEKQEKFPFLPFLVHTDQKRHSRTMLRLDSTGVHDSHDTSYSCSEAEDPAQEEAGVMLEVAIPDGRMEAAYSDTENMKVSRSLVR